LGHFTHLIHRDDTNNIIAYHRKDAGGPGDDTVVIVNFGNTAFEQYDLHLPVKGDWRVRFNSSWKGYSVDFHEIDFALATAEDTGKTTIAIAEFSVLIISIEN